MFRGRRSLRPVLPSGGCAVGRRWSTTSRRWPTWASSPGWAPTGGGAWEPRTTRVRSCSPSRGPWPARGCTRLPTVRGSGTALALAGPARSPGVLVGGYFGTWLTPAQAAGARLSRASLDALGGSLGCGVVAVLPDRVCPLEESARVVRWLAGESAGQCGPCVNGLPAIAGALEALARGTDVDRAEQQARRWAGMVEGRGGCKLPDGAARFVRSALHAFSTHVALHLSTRRPVPAVRFSPVAAVSGPGIGPAMGMRMTPEPDPVRRKRLVCRAGPGADQSRRLGVPRSPARRRAGSSRGGRAEGCVGVPGACTELAALSGRRIVKTAPPVAPLAAATEPPCLSTIARTMASPRPDPPLSLDRELSPR